MLAINTSADSISTFELSKAAEQFSLTARTLQASVVELNGRTLELTANGEVPATHGNAVAAGAVQLPPASLTFFAIADAGNPACGG